MIPAALFLAALLLGLAACRGACALVRRLDLLDHPNERSSHERPTPRGGGLGVLAAALPVAAAWAWVGGSGEPRHLLLLGAALLLAALGFRDDLAGVPPPVKLVLQAAAAILATAAAGAVERVALPGGTLALGALAAPLTVVFLVAVINACNFMDGIDGIAGLHGGLAALGLGAVGLVGGGGGGWLAFPLAGACLSFLSVNWSPARVFLGDVGSLPVGLLLGALAVLVSRGEPAGFAAAFLCLGPFLFDTAYTLVRRALRGERLFSAHRSHLYQRLVIAGWSHARTSLVYGAWTILSGGLGVLYVGAGAALRGAILAVAALSGAGMVLVTVGTERRRVRHGAA